MLPQKNIARRKSRRPLSNTESSKKASVPKVGHYAKPLNIGFLQAADETSANAPLHCVIGLRLEVVWVIDQRGFTKNIEGCLGSQGAKTLRNWVGGIPPLHLSGEYFSFLQ
jgi:hypothetical protein